MQPVDTCTCHRILVLRFFVSEAKEDVIADTSIIMNFQTQRVLSRMIREQLSHDL